MHLKYHTSSFFLALYIYKRSPRHMSADNIYNEQNFGAQGVFDKLIWIYSTYQAYYSFDFVLCFINIL